MWNDCARGERRVWAVVPAAGSSERFSSTTDSLTPKQYAPLLGASVLEWSLRRLLAQNRIHAVVAVLASDDARWPSIASRLANPRLQSAVGGASRQLSVQNGLEHLVNQATPNDWVLVHDAARPCVTSDELQALFAALDAGAAGAVLATPIIDTVKRHRGATLETLDRQGLWRALTPQVFEFAALRHALDQATRSAVLVGDEAQAMERMGIVPAMVQGSPFNIKVTSFEDLAVASKILQMGTDAISETLAMRIGQGFDVHAFGAGDHIMLAGIRIQYARGVVAHSDGDVVIHALCDALLGALGQGDIGQHFPDSEQRYRGADSRIFLRAVALRMRAAGLELVNADITVLAEAPRIAAHRDAMVAALAADLGTIITRINIKATTTERLGFIGRGEGLAALVVVLLG